MSVVHARRARFHVSPACLLAIALLCSALHVSSLRAQGQPEGEGAPSEPSAPDGEPQRRVARIVFLLPDLDATTLTQLNEALLAQLSLVDAELVVRQEPLSMQGAPALTRTRVAQTIAEQEQAQVVIWLETEREGRWLLHVLDAAQSKVVVRPLDARDAQRPAAIEAVGVLAREASRAVFVEHAAEPPKPSVAIEAPTPAPSAQTATPAPPPRAAATDRGLQWRFGLGYVGSDFAPEARFSHGAALSARLDFAEHLFAGLSAGLFERAEPSAAPFSVGRIALSVHGGYRAALLSGVWVDAELGVCLDVLDRRARAVASPPNTEITTSEDTTRVTVGLCPRARLEYKPLQLLGIFAGLGVDVLLTNLTYAATRAEPTGADGQSDLLRPRWIRPALELGIAFYP